MTLRGARPHTRADTEPSRGMDSRSKEARPRVIAVCERRDEADAPLEAHAADGDRRRPIVRRRPYFPLPAWRALPLSDRQALESLQAAWDAQPSGRLRLRGDAGTIAPHPLSEHFRTGFPAQVPERSDVEWFTFLHAWPNLGSALASSGSGAFNALVRDIAFQTTGISGELRTGPARTNPDASGRGIEFPPPETLPGRLETLHRFLAATEGPSAFKSLVAMVAITNAHPFADGNGRVSRVLANLCLNLGRTTDTFAFLPIREIGNQPAGNLTLYAREAELRGAWGPIAGLFSAGLAAVLSAPD